MAKYLMTQKWVEKLVPKFTLIIKSEKNLNNYRKHNLCHMCQMCRENLPHGTFFCAIRPGSGSLDGQACLRGQRAISRATARERLCRELAPGKRAPAR